MKKNIYIVLFLIFLPFLLFGRNLKDVLTPDEAEWLDSHRNSIDVLFGYEDPPQAYTDIDGNYTGIFVDVMRLIESELGQSFRFRMFSSWSELIGYAERSGNFIIVGITPTAERTGFLSFSEVIFSRPHVVIQRKGSGFESPADLAGLKVAYIDGYVVGDFLDRAFPDFEPVGVKDNYEGLSRLSSGEFDAMVTSSGYAAYYIPQYELINLEVAFDVGFDADIAAACSVSEPLFASVLRKAVSALDPEDIDRIIRKWIIYEGRDVDKMRLFLRVLTIILSASALIILIVSLWLWSLRRTVDAQTKEIRREVEQKEALIQEIHHRVRNSFNIMSALIDLEREGITSLEEALIVLEKLEKRIDSMSLIHQNLYNEDDFSRIDMSGYLTTLQEKYSEEGSGCCFESDCVLMDINTAVPFGMLVNEIIHLFYRLASLDGRSADVFLSLSTSEEDSVLVIEDPGADMGEYSNLPDIKFSWLLIEHLTEQLGAAAETSSDGSGRFRLRMKNSELFSC